MKMFALVRLLALTALSTFPALAAPPVTLQVETVNDSELTPRSAFELRFDEAMIADDAVGKAGAEAPLVIAPEIKGNWVWLSTQSGVFTLSEPPPLGGKFQVTLRGGLKTAAGKDFRGTIKQSFTTPPFRVKGT